MYLHNNKIETLLVTTFMYLPSLVHIDISYNLLQSFDINIFRRNTKLKSIRLSNNLISKFILPHNRLVSLNYIDLTYNKLTEQIDYEILSDNNNIVLDMRSNEINCGCKNMSWIYFYDYNSEFTNIIQHGCLWLSSYSYNHTSITNLFPNCGMHLTSKCPLIERQMKRRRCTNFQENESYKNLFYTNININV